jgi:hypothetical protein
MKNNLHSLASTLLFAAFWHFAGLLVLLLLPFLVTGDSVPVSDKRDMATLAAIALAFFASGGIDTLIWLSGARITWARTVAIIGVIFFTSALGVLTLDSDVKPEVLVGALLAGLALSLLFVVGLGYRTVATIGVGTVAVLSIIATDIGELRQKGRGTSVTTVNLSTQFYDLQATYFAGRIPRSRRGGAIDRLKEGFIVVTGDGRFREVLPDWEADSLHVNMIDLPNPLNIDAFERSAPPEVDLAKFRVADIYVALKEGRYSFFVTHHFWVEDRNCVVMRLSATTANAAAPLPGQEYGDWQTIYETSPCLPLKSNGHPFAGHQSGGRIAALNETEILVTIGDHEFDGQATPSRYPQAPDTAYGKIVRINLESGASDYFSLGHRNPQGLFINESGQIWSTEHGPKGGDELNLIEQGGNYGWPVVTLGSITVAVPGSKTQIRVAMKTTSNRFMHGCLRSAYRVSLESMVAVASRYGRVIFLSALCVEKHSFASVRAKTAFSSQSQLISAPVFVTFSLTATDE